jgi:biopolymer transport protein ExbD
MAISFDQPNGSGDGFDYRPMSEINVTPLVDVMLVLLVIFMVTAPLMVQGVPLELPKTSATKLTQPKRPMVISLGRDGTLYIRDEKIGFAQFGARLATVHATEGDEIVYVRADRGTPYGDVMSLLSRVGASGYAHVSLLAQPEGASEAAPAR